MDLDPIARATAGFTGADLENLLNEAALLCRAAAASASSPMEAICSQSIIKVIAGPEKHSRVVPEARAAAHGLSTRPVTPWSMHALPDLDPVHQITIVPRGQAGGMTIYLPEEDRSYLSRQLYAGPDGRPAGRPRGRGA